MRSEDTREDDGRVDGSQRFEVDNVYGNALTLLYRNRTVPYETTGPDALHLDIACGPAALAAVVTSGLGRTYVGIDASADAVEALRARGYEGHVATLDDRETTATRLREIVGDRRVASISLLGVLHAMPPGQSVLAGIRDVAREQDAVVVVSTPNVTHADVGFKLAFGRWDVTNTGMLGSASLRHFDHREFDRELRRSGLYPFDRRDVVRERSDQHFPLDHPALLRGTSLHGLLLALRETADSFAQVSEFVWLCSPGPESVVATQPAGPEHEAERPFLSVIMRTQGARLHCLTEALTCMAGQSNTDFEVLVMGHRLTPEAQAGVEGVIEDCPEWLRRKVRLVKVERGRRATPLNEGFAAARGHYIAILDDDDLPLGHWVETFAALGRQAPGRVLRTISARQDIEEAEVLGLPAVRSVGPVENIYPRVFDFVDHLRQNYTPNTAIAFPRGIFHDLGLRFDETLTTTEDWDFIMRAVSVVGVESHAEITCLYHWWVQGASSRTDHDPGEWDRNLQAILRKFDENPILIPAGGAARIREALAELDGLRWSLEHEKSRARGQEVGADVQARLDVLREIQDILDSRSWRITAPLRAASMAVGRGRRIRLTDYFTYSLAELRQVVTAMRSSTSWRITRPLRR